MPIQFLHFHSSRKQNKRFVSSFIRFVLDTTIGDRAFPVAGAIVWNSMPDDITSSSTIHIFRARLKTCLIRYSFPGATV
jgi:hypothetical protein